MATERTAKLISKDGYLGKTASLSMVSIAPVEVVVNSVRRSFEGNRASIASGWKVPNVERRLIERPMPFPTSLIVGFVARS